MITGSAADRLHIVVLHHDELQEQLDRGNEVITLSADKYLHSPGYGRTALIVSEVESEPDTWVPAITHLGRVQAIVARTKLDSTWRLSNIVELPAHIHLDDLAANLSRHLFEAFQNAAQTRRGNGLDGAVSAGLRAYLETVIPPETWRDAMPVTERFQDAPGRLVVEEQIDAIRSALWISDMDRSVLRDAAPQEFSVLTSLVPNPTEPSLIDHDLRHFPGMHGMPARVDVYVFTEGRHRLEVINVNATSVESATGVDLIYFNHRFDSLVAVQYKRMESDSGDRVAAVDTRLPGQLKKMAQVDALSAVTEDPLRYRLGSATCFVKFAYSNATARSTDELVKGIYVPAQLIRRLLDAGTLVGPRGGATITHDNLGRWLSNSLFAELVKNGWIGSSNVSVDAVRDFVSTSLSRNRSVVIAAHAEET